MKHLILFILFLSSCARAPLSRLEDSMRPAKNNPVFVDHLSDESFLSALKKHLAVMKNSSLVLDPMTFGKTKIGKADYIKALEQIFEHQDNWREWVAANFDFYEVYGKDDWAEVMVTGYYEPKVKGSLVESSEFSQALYAMPSDLVSVDLKNFANKFPVDQNLGVLQGRLENQNLVPYFDRKQIDADFKLKDKKLELAWVDPVDAFFIQIQGSGVVEFSDGEKMRVGYAGQNGHSYVPIGKFLTHVIPMESMSMQKIKSHLQTSSASEKRDMLNKNPSYVFFKKLESDALTYAGMEVSEGRTIATDLTYFPKGALAFLDIEEPQFDSPEAIEPMSWKRTPRLVFDQDTGGAIKGGARVDLYFGQGEIAAQKAGVMKQKGRLYYLLPRVR